MQKKILSMIISKNRYLELDLLLTSLIVKQIPYAIIKGEPLSLAAYGKVGQRISSDIDLLMSIKNIDSFKSGLLSCGFKAQNINRFDQVTAVSFTHQSVPYYKMSNQIKIEVDLNHDLFWGEYEGKRVDIDDFLSDTIEMDIYGVKVKTLPPLKAMIQLILHHYKEMNSIYHLAGHNCIKHNMFKDVYYLWKSNQDLISLDKLYSLSCEYEIIPYVYYILYFTNWIFCDSELQKYVLAFKTEDGINLLDYYGLANSERKLWKVDFKTRLESDNLFELIKDDLTESDFEKLERNRRIFG